MDSSKLTKLATQPLEFNRNYLIGRDEDCDFQVNSTLVSRQQLQLKLGPVDRNQLENHEYKTQLTVTVLSRARSKINGESYKLGKNEKPQHHDFTQESLLDIEFKDSNNADGSIKYQIEWIPFVMMPSSMDTKSSLHNDLKRLHHESIDLRITSTIDNATHIYTLKDIPDGNIEDYDHVCLGMAKGLPILTNTWFKSIYEKKSSQDLILAIDYIQFLPKYNGKLLLLALPNPLRSKVLDDYVIFSFNTFLFEENLVVLMGGKIRNILLIKFFEDGVLNETSLLNEIKQVSTKSLLLKYSSSDQIKSALTINDQLESFCKSYKSQIVLKNMLLDSLETASSDVLATLDFSLKHPLEQTGQPVQGRRKRVKYEKVSKMHFFDLEATPSLQEPNEESKKVSSESEETDPQGQHVSLTPIEVAETQLPDVTSPSKLPTSKEGSVEEAKPKPKDDTTRGQLKRNNSTSEQPKKIPKFIPDFKVSLSSAIKQTKELATRLVEEELGIEKKEPDLNDDMENLVIVEVVDFPKRTVPKPINQIDNDRFSGRKNFKTFKKNLRVKSNSSREFVNLEDATTQESATLIREIEDPKPVSIEDEMQSQFNGYIKDVVIGESNGLFVEDSDTEEIPESIFTSHPNSTTSSVMNTKNKVATTRTRRINNKNYGPQNNHDDDDDDDDDDGPKFGFTR